MSVRDLGRHRSSCRTSNRLLERAQASLRLGTPSAPSTTPQPRCCGPPRNLTDLADEPLRAKSESATPMIDQQIRDRALGAYLGLACGDALGATVEFMTKSEIAR